MTQSKPYQPITLNFLKQKKVDKMTLEAYPRYFGGILGEIWHVPMNLEDRVAKIIYMDFDFIDMAEKLLDRDDKALFYKNRSKSLDKWEVRKKELIRKLLPRNWQKMDHSVWLRYSEAHLDGFNKTYHGGNALCFCRLYRKGMRK